MSNRKTRVIFKWWIAPTNVVPCFVVSMFSTLPFSLLPPKEMHLALVVCMVGRVCNSAKTYGTCMHRMTLLF